MHSALVMRLVMTFLMREAVQHVYQIKWLLCPRHQLLPDLSCLLHNERSCADSVTVAVFVLKEYSDLLI